MRYQSQLGETLAVAAGLLYARGNFNGSWNQLLREALMDAQIALSTGFRSGTTFLPARA